MYRKVLSILTDQNKLRTVSEPFPDVESWNEDHKSAIRDLVDTFNVIQGLGLAAPQIGIQKRAVIVNPAQLGIPQKSESLILINPEIKTSGDVKRSKEACFSVPYVDGFVERPQQCEVSYFDESGNPHTLKAEGYAAVCLQHEIDHLDGVLYIDRMGSLSRKMLLKKVEKAEKRRSEAARLARESFDNDHRSLTGARPQKTTHSKKRKPKVRKQRPKRSKKGK